MRFGIRYEQSPNVAVERQQDPVRFTTDLNDSCISCSTVDGGYFSDIMVLVDQPPNYRMVNIFVGEDSHSSSGG